MIKLRGKDQRGRGRKFAHFATSQDFKSKEQGWIYEHRECVKNQKFNRANTLMSFCNSRYHSGPGAVLASIVSKLAARIPRRRETTGNIQATHTSG